MKRQGDWRKKEEISLVEVKEGLTKISNAIANLNKNDVAVYSPDQIEVRLYASTVPGLNLDYFEIDDEVVANILSNIADKNQWLSIATLFPILYEASPYAITTRLDEEWERETGLKEIFVDAHDAGIFAKNEYTHFLWGVEQFFCQKEYVAWAVRWMLRMNELRRKYPISNSPYETLSIVFCAWYNNTILTQQEKIFLAREAFEKGYDVWDLFYSEMPGMKTSVFGSTPKPKYRITSDPAELTNRDVWEALRETIYKNRYFNSSDWAMSEDRLTILEKTLNSIHLEDEVYEYRYLFKNKYEFPLLHPHPYSEDERREQNEQLIEEEISKWLSDFRERELNVLELARLCSEYDYSILGKYLFTVFCQKTFDEELFLKLLEDEKLKSIMLDYLQAVYYCAEEEYKKAYQLAKKSDVSIDTFISILLIETFNAEKNPLIMNEDEKIKRLYWNSFRRGLFVEN